MSPEAQAMLDRIRSHRHVSMVELTRTYEEVVGEGSAKGEVAIGLDNCPNLYLWAGVSEEFAVAFGELQPATKLEPCSLFVYLIDGGMLSWPVAKRPPKNGYREPHWVPVVLNPKAAA